MGSEPAQSVVETGLRAERRPHRGGTLGEQSPALVQRRGVGGCCSASCRQLKTAQVVKDFLAHHMAKLGEGVVKILEFAALMRDAFIPQHSGGLDSAAADTDDIDAARALRSRVLAVAGMVQRDPLSAQQVEGMRHERDEGRQD